MFDFLYRDDILCLAPLFIIVGMLIVGIIGTFVPKVLDWLLKE